MLNLASVSDNPVVAQWIDFSQPGIVRLRTGKVEIGQGILTALAQVGADELRVDLDQIEVVPATTASGPNEGFTAGSLSVATSATALRLACATARELFLSHLVAEFGHNSPITVSCGQFTGQGLPAGIDYWSLRDRVDLDVPIDPALPLGTRTPAPRVGQPVARTDLPRKLTGAGFIHDLAFDGMLHARVVRAADRRIEDMDALLARCLKVRFDDVRIVRLNNFTALIHEDEVVLRAAADSVCAALLKQPTTLEPDDLKPESLLNAALQTTTTIVDGPPREGARCGRTFSAVYSRPFLAHGSIGPSCALALHAGGRLQIWTHSQGIHPLRRAIADLLGADPASVEVHHVEGAGCYGHNGADDAAVDAAIVARECPGRPIRLQWSRAQELSASPYGPPSIVRITAQTGDDGVPINWSNEIWTATHSQRPGTAAKSQTLGEIDLHGRAVGRTAFDVPDIAGAGGKRNAVALYDLPSQTIVYHLATDLKVRTSALRGLGTHANVFAIESFIDELAEAHGRDPVEYRLQLLRDPRARHVLARAASLAEWQHRPKGGAGHGMGCAFSRYKNSAAYVAMICEVDVGEDVDVRRIWCVADAGLVINPDGARNQIEGGIIQALSWTTIEQVKLDDDRLLPRLWSDYPILRFSRIPELSVELVADTDGIPLGVGEVALGPLAGSVANAVADALGVRVRNLPLTRDNIVAAMA